MGTIISQKDMIEIFDQVTREIIRRDGGILLQFGATEPAGELCTVYATFSKGYHTSLSLCAESFMFNRLARYMMQVEEITPQDVEDSVKEFFNVLCGHIVSRVFQRTKVAARFSVPTFYREQYVPQDQHKKFCLTYVSDEDEHAQIVYYDPFEKQNEQKEGVLP